MDRRVKILFCGDKKNTSYRFFIKQKALELGLKGKCFLNSEECFEVEVEGRSASVDEFIFFIQKGVSSLAAPCKFSLETFNDLKGYTSMESDIV